jgi:flagellum-specific peptidoglycan hydrolase FlgJ
MTNNEFIETIGALIQKHSFANGYKYPSAIIGQAILESGWGKSLLASKYHNYFGLKCGSSWRGKSVNMTTKEEYTRGTLTNIRDNFRVFDTMEDGIKGYFEFISYSRYSNLKSATSSKNYLQLIKSDGYATSSTYVDNVYNVVTKYNLTRFDKERVDNMTNADIKKHLSGNEIIKLLAKEVINGGYGNGNERKERLGCLYSLVQKEVNKMV